MAEPRKILLVDGDNEARRRMATALRAAGHHDVAQAGDGELAERILDRRGPFALVTLDVHLPDQSGLRLLKKLAPLAPQTVVLMVTARHGLATAIECLKRGAYDYVFKPVQAEDIQFSVANALRRRQRELEGLRRHQQIEQMLQSRMNVLQETQAAVLRAICRMAEFRNPRHVHPERVARYGRRVAEDLARRSPYAPFVDEEFLRNIPEAALLHDIGKLALPDSVLLKPDKLDPEEMEVAESHTTVGRDICQVVKEQLECEDHRFIDMAIEVTGSHHERWDGRGYPDRLEGSQIPLSARIVSLADYYDIWRTPVVYRPEVLPVEDVVGRIEQQSGRKFDPVVVDAFNRCRESFTEVERELSP